MTLSDKRIEPIINKLLQALPIFAIVMIVYYVSVTTVGTIATDWANDGVFGDGWYLAGIGRSAYEEDAGEYGDAETIINAFGDESGDARSAAADS